jgi:PAS domain S-box-containing protein
VAGTYGIRSQLQIAVRPRRGGAWVLGIHHCAEARLHDAADASLFKAIAQRVSETLTTLLTLRDLRASEEKLRALTELAPVGIFETDARGDCTFANRAWREMAGLSAAEAAGRGWVKGLHPDDRARVAEEWYETVRDQGSWKGEFRFLAPSGTVTWVESAALPLRDRRGDATGFIGTNVDITKRKRVDAIHAVLVRGGREGSKETFFETMARFLAESLGMDFVCIDRLEGDGLKARTVAVWCDGGFQDNVTYALADTPCGEVVGKTVCCFPAGVCQFFPRDEVLRELRAESYVGVTLWDNAGQPIGLIAVIGRKPLLDRQVAEETLNLVSVRAAGEMERMRGEQAVRERLDELSRWQEVTLGREERILELKREVNEILLKAGQARRYQSAGPADVPEGPAS